MNEWEERDWVPLYKTQLRLIVSDDIANSRNLRYKDFGICDKDLSNVGALCSKEGMTIGLFFQHGQIFPGTIAHEVWHSTCYSLAKAGVKSDDEEAHAYLCEWITNWIYCTMKRRKEKIKL